MIEKIISVVQLNKILKSKRHKKKIALCHGVFDLLHPGHINHFNQAKKFVIFLLYQLQAIKMFLRDQVIHILMKKIG